MTDANPFGPDKPEQAKQSEPESGWVYIGSDTVKNTRRIYPPKEIYNKAEILDKSGDAYWSYDKITGTLIVSNNELKETEYNTVDRSTIYGPQNNYGIQIPWPFFASLAEKPEAVPSGAKVEKDERRHFVYHEGLGMHRGETRSCFVFTDDELMNRVKDADNLSREFDSAPRFL